MIVVAGIVIFFILLIVTTVYLTYRGNSPNYPRDWYETLSSPVSFENVECDHDETDCIVSSARTVPSQIALSNFGRSIDSITDVLCPQCQGFISNCSLCRGSYRVSLIGAERYLLYATRGNEPPVCPVCEGWGGTSHCNYCNSVDAVDLTSPYHMRVATAHINEFYANYAYIGENRRMVATLPPSVFSNPNIPTVETNVEPEDIMIQTEDKKLISKTYFLEI